MQPEKGSCDTHTAAADSEPPAPGMRRRAVSKAATAASAAAKGTTAAVASVAETAGRGAKKGRDTTAAAAGQVSAAAQTLLSSDLSDALNRLADAALSGSATVYDMALDANYLDPVLRGGLGGSYHRLFDGGHTVLGAAKAGSVGSFDNGVGLAIWLPGGRGEMGCLAAVLACGCP